MKSQPLRGARLTRLLVLLGLTLLLAGSVFGVDWANYFLGSNLLYPAVGKPFITLLALVMLLTGRASALGKRDWWLVFGAFGCMLPTDVLMSVVVVSPSLDVGSSVFMAGGILSIVAHLFLIARLGRAWSHVELTNWRGLWLPIVLYGSAVLVVLLLWPGIVRVGHAAIAPAYTAFFCTTAWLAWETVRHRLLPAPNAWMAAIAATCWYATEITGEIYNLALGNISEILFRVVWVFYATNVILWALSALDWGSGAQTEHAPSSK